MSGHFAHKLTLSPFGAYLNLPLAIIFLVSLAGHLKLVQPITCKNFPILVLCFLFFWQPIAYCTFPESPQDQIHGDSDGELQIKRSYITGKVQWLTDVYLGRGFYFPLLYATRVLFRTKASKIDRWTAHMPSLNHFFCQCYDYFHKTACVSATKLTRQKQKRKMEKKIFHTLSLYQNLTKQFAQANFCFAD